MAEAQVLAQSPEMLMAIQPDARAHSEIGRYLDWLERERGLCFDGYDELWQWSVDEVEAVS